MGSDAANQDAPYDDDYPTCERCTAALLIYSDQVTPAEISGVLGFEPTHARHRGEPRNPAKPEVAIAKRHLWFYDTEELVHSRDLRRHVDHVLERLTGRTQALASLRTRPGIEIRFSCIWWSRQGGGGPMLWPRQLGALGDLDLGLEIEFAYYGND